MTTGQDTMARPQRYQFDEVFAVGIEEPPCEPTVDIPTMTAAVEEARREGYEHGLREGHKAASEKASARLADCAAQLLKRVESLNDAAEAEHRRIEAEAVSLGIATARKLASALIAREPAAELEALLRSCLGELRDAPHIVIRVSEDMTDVMREVLEAVGRETGFTGRLVVLGEPGMEPGDGRIDWADGGIVRDRAAVDAAVDAAVARYLSGDDAGSKDEDHG
jgi:flagellar assembly protein FliH